MATYIPGVQDYIPQIQPFTPDYNFYSQALDLRQSKHDAAREQLSTLYGSLLNSPMARDENIQARDNFFKTIDQDIKKMSGMDLSKSQNTEAAMSIFNQLLDNKNIQKDMAWTRNFQSEMKRADSFRNCKDPEKCGGSWWDGGEQLLMHDYNDFKNATTEEAMNMGNARFTPYQDVTKKAMALAKEADLNVEIDQVTGSWIITHKNGKLIEDQLHYLFMGSIGNDPKVQEYYNAKAKLERKNYVANNAAKYGSAQAAEQVYINQIATTYEKQIAEASKRAKEAADQKRGEQKKLSEAASTAPVEQRNKLQELEAEYANIGNAYQAAADHAESTNGEITVAKNNGKYSAENIDAILAYGYLTDDINVAAQVMSQRNASIKYEANPYGLEAVRHQNQMQLAEFNFQHNVALKQMDQQFELFKLDYESKGGEEYNKATKVPIEGGSVVGDEDPDSPEVQTRRQLSYEEDRDEILKGMVGGEMNMIQDFIKRSTQAATAGNATAQKDIIEMANKIVYFSGDEDRVEDYEEAMSKAHTTAEKYKIAKTYADMNGASNVTIDNVYDYVYSVADPTQTVQNGVLRNHLNGFWGNHSRTIREVTSRNIILSQLETDYVKNVNDVINAVRTSYGDKEAKILQAYIGKDGRPNDIRTFVNKMVKYGFDADDARDMYALDADGYYDEDKVQYKFGKYFTDFSKSTGDQAWTSMKGDGNSIYYGSQYIADPARPGSIGAQGTRSFMKEALFNPNAIFYNGNLKDKTPINNDKARAIIQTVYDDFKQSYKVGKGVRPELTVTYAHIAGGDPNKVALNIKIPQSYSKQYEGTGKNAGTMVDMENLATQGITIVIDKGTAKNLFTQGATLTAPEILMRRTGKIDYNIYPEYFQNFAIQSNNQTGEYYLEGKMRVGLDKTGKGIWQNIYYPFPYESDLNQIVADVDELVTNSINGNLSDDDLYKKLN